MPPKFGMLTTPWEDVLEQIKLASDLGMDYVEIGMEPPRGRPEQLLRKSVEITSLLERYGMFALAHTAWWYDLGSPFEGVRKAWVEEGKKSIDACVELEAGKVVFHFDNFDMMGFEDGRFRRKILDDYADSIRQLVDHGKERGVKVVMENGSFQMLCSRIENFGYVINRVRDLGLHLDFGHLFIAEGKSGCTEAIRRFSRRLEHVHMSDNSGRSDDHLPLGTGELDYEGIVRALRRIRYKKTITFEVFTRDRDYVEYSMQKIRDAWKKR